MAQCCRCNRTGSCRRCACVKAGRHCLPSKLGTCSNCPTPASSAAPATTQSSNTTETSVGIEATVETRASSNPHPGPPLSTSHERSSHTPQAPSPHNQDSIQCPPDEPQLPPHVPMNAPSFLWGSLNADDFSHALEGTYSEVVHWRLNNFKVPAGKNGKEFVRELSNLFSSASSMESIALKATVIMPILLLQKPNRRSKTKDHVACLGRRLRAWKKATSTS